MVAREALASVLGDRVLLLRSRAVAQIDDQREQMIDWLLNQDRVAVNMERSDLVRLACTGCKDLANMATELLCALVDKFDLDYNLATWDGVVPVSFSTDAWPPLCTLEVCPFLCGSHEREGLCAGICRNATDCHGFDLVCREVCPTQQLPSYLLAVMQLFVQGRRVAMRTRLSIDYLDIILDHLLRYDPFFSS